MASTYSTSLRLELMATGDQSGTWGDTTNTNLGTLLEQAITGVLSVAQGDTTLTLTSTDGASDQARNAVVNLTGAMTGAQNVIVPDANKLYLIKNSTTGGFAVTVKTSAGTGVAVPAGTARWVYADGTNVVDGLSGPWSPSSNDAQALGISGTAWSDLFLASGAVVNFNAGDVTITHSANTLAFAGASSGYTFDAVISGTTASMTGTVSSTGSSAGFVGFQAVSTQADAAAGPIIELYRNSATPATSDILGQILFNGEDSAGNTQEYASIEAVITDATSASEDSTLNFYTQVAGVRTLALTLPQAASGRAIGELVFYSGSTVPSLCLAPFGQNVNRTTYAAYFAEVGTTYGAGDGSTTFTMPDYRGRVIAGKDDMGGTSANRLTNPTGSTIGGIDGDVLGGVGGAETHVITIAQLAAHTHGYATGPGGFEFGNGNSGTIRQTGSTGSNTPHNNVQPTAIANIAIYVGV
jgi:microcystin-dependent protein